MFRSCTVKPFTNGGNISRNLKICRNVGLLSGVTEGFLGVQTRSNLTSLSTFRFSGDFLPLPHSIGNKLPRSRNIHISNPTRSNFSGENQRKEQRDNIIFCTVLAGIVIALFLFSLTMKVHDDTVYYEPPVKKK